MGRSKKPIRAALTMKLRSMKRGDRFTVKTASERVEALNLARTLRELGAVDFKLHTYATDDGFEAVAV
jgi:hypothetical protein